MSHERSINIVKCNCNTIFLFLTGVVNRGDSFRRRRSRSNSLAPQQTSSATQELNDPNRSRGNGCNNSNSPISPLANALAGRSVPDRANATTYRVALVGAHGVGKSALVGQFMTSECINAYERVRSGQLNPSNYLK